MGALKLDMEKAYDRVSLVFQKKVIKEVGFNEQWIQIIMECVSTVKYHLLLNGGIIQAFNPGKGLRQGDRYPHTFSFYIKMSCPI